MSSATLGLTLTFIHDHLYDAIVCMQVHFNTNNPSNPSGQAGLTMLAMGIGEAILKEFRDSKASRSTTRAEMIDQVRVGDLFIEPLVKFGFVDLVRPVTKDGMYFVQVGERWHEIGEDLQIKETLHLSDEPITDGCRIKGNEGKSKQEAPWRRAASDLMGVAWSINKPVYEALIASKDMFVSDTPVEVVDDFTALQESTPSF